MTAPRIVSLLPSATEIVCGLGMAEYLVGVSHECDYPPEVVGLPVLTSAKMKPSPRSADIDRDVRAVLRDALAVYDIDTAELARLRPDVIVTQDLCDVCAVSFDDVCTAARELANPDLQIVNTHPTRLADVWRDIERVAGALHREAAARDLLAAMDARVAAVRERARGLERRRVLAIEWLDPVMLGGMWSPELIELAGGESVGAAAGQHAPTLSRDDLAALPTPDVVLIKPCGFDIARILDERALVSQLVNAVAGPRTRTFVADGNALFNRPGPRLVDSLEVLAGCIHPEVFGDPASRHAAFCQPFSPDPRS